MDDELLLADLEEFAAGDEPATDVDEEFSTAASEEDAARLMRMVRWLDREAAKVRRVADSQVATVRAWETDRTAGLTRRRAWAERALEGWMRATGATTRSLPAGTLRLRSPHGRLELVDEAAFVEWARDAGRLDLLKLSAAKSEIKQAAVPGNEIEWAEGFAACALVDSTTGEVIPGVALVTMTDKTFSAQVAP